MSQRGVAPLAGAWIEISRQSQTILFTRSPPSWGRGLKFRNQVRHLQLCRVAPLAGGVD